MGGLCLGRWEGGMRGLGGMWVLWSGVERTGRVRGRGEMKAIFDGDGGGTVEEEDGDLRALGIMVDRGVWWQHVSQKGTFYKVEILIITNIPISLQQWRNK